MTSAAAFQNAIQLHQAGRLAEAEAIYRQILAAEPRHADALHLLGVIALQVGRNDLAADWFCQAVALTPDAPDFHSNLGEAYRKIGRADEAIAAYRVPDKKVKQAFWIPNPGKSVPNEQRSLPRSGNRIALVRWVSEQQ